MSTQLNCKPGDRAIVIKSKCGNEGRIVRVICASAANGVPLGVGYVEHDGTMWLHTAPGFVWFCESFGSSLNAVGGVAMFHARPFADAYLRPLPPEQSTEAMRRLHETTAPAKPKEPVVKPFQWEEL